MSYVLILDDLRPISALKFIEKYELMEKVLVKSYEEFINILNQKGLPEMVSIDHDLHPLHYKIGARNNFMSLLGYEKCNIPTGLNAAKYLIKYCQEKKLKLPVCYSHSQNPAGRQAILELIKKYKEKEVEIIINKEQNAAKN